MRGIEPCIAHYLPFGQTGKAWDKSPRNSLFI